MTQLNSILYEAPPGPVRNAIVEFLKGKTYEKLIFPAPGRFAVPYAVARSGVAPSKIECSGTSLITSVIGYYLSDQDLNNLQVNSEFDFIIPGASQEEYAARILYGIKVAQAKDDNYYNAELKRALLYKPEAHIKKIQEGLKKLKQRLGGISYNQNPMSAQIQSWKDKNALIFLDPSFYDLTKRLDTGTKITWKEPGLEIYSKTDLKDLCTGLINSKATVLVLKYKERDDIPEEYHTFQLTADSKLKMVYLFMNKNVDDFHIARPKFNQNKALPYPIITKDDIITAKSKVTLIPVDLDVANYYRDLFTHKLGASLAETNVLFLIDGKIIAIRGYTSAAQAKTGQVHEIYGIVHNNTRYKHLGRLIMRLITTRQFEQVINKTLFELKEITSTKLIKHKEYREAKNILELYEQEEQKDGTWKSKYAAKFRDITFEQCVNEFLKEEASYEQRPRRKPRKIRSVGGTRRQSVCSENQG